MSGANQNSNSSNTPSTAPDDVPLKTRENLEDVEMQEVQEGEPTSSPFTSPSKRVVYSDRFIPSRAESSHLNYSVLERDIAAAEVSKSALSREDFNPAYNLLLQSELLGYKSSQPISPDKHAQLEQLKSPRNGKRKMLRFMCGDCESPPGGPSPPSPYSKSPLGGDGVLGASVPMHRRAPRRIARTPFKVLDAPALQDDFYLNLVDWSSQNVLAVGLGSCVYLWSACTSRVTKLCDLAPNDSVCSVAWSQRGTYLSVGTHLGDVQLWDATRLEKLKTMGGHRVRVGTMAWHSRLLSSGSRDRNILQHDVRVKEHYISKLLGHKSEVCGLKWSPDDRQLASGGNDNQLYIWELNSTNPLLQFKEHTAAVKAIAWSPHQHGLLASGGGTADRCIRFWNTTTNTSLTCVDTGSQVCNLSWSKNVNEIVSTHGYSQNQIIVWKYPSMTKLATLTGHTLRVLYLAVSPDGQTIVTGAGDETLRFWTVFPGPRSQGGGNDLNVSFMRSQIR